jgi:hypothetical protein
MLSLVAQLIADGPQGTVQKLAEPTYYDFMFPLLAFCLVIVLPASTALWVIFKTVTEKQPEADEK